MDTGDLLVTLSPCPLTFQHDTCHASPLDSQETPTLQRKVRIEQGAHDEVNRPFGVERPVQEGTTSNLKPVYRGAGPPVGGGMPSDLLEIGSTDRERWSTPLRSHCHIVRMNQREHGASGTCGHLGLSSKPPCRVAPSRSWGMRMSIPRSTNSSRETRLRNAERLIAKWSAKITGTEASISIPVVFISPEYSMHTPFTLYVRRRPRIDIQDGAWPGTGRESQGIALPPWRPLEMSPGAASHQVGGAKRDSESKAPGQLGGAIPVEDDVALQNLDIALQALKR